MKITSSVRLALAVVAGAAWLSGVVVVGGSRVESSALLAKAFRPGSQTSAPAGGDAENGKTLYGRYGCWSCHGYEAQGGPGRRLAPNPPALPVFTRSVRSPDRMPPYTEKVVTDQELADIRAYLDTLPGPPDLATIPLLQGQRELAS